MNGGVSAWLVRCALFLVGLVALDRGVGGALDAAMGHIRTGEGSGAANAVLDHGGDDVLVFGSSRAKQHVDPAVIEARTGWTVYNAAANGQGLPYAVAVQSLLRTRGRLPRCWVLHVDVVDLVEPKLDRVAVLMPFAREDPEILALVAQHDRWAKVKAWSWAWRYNGVALSVVRNLFVAARPGDRGFTPRAERRKGFADDREFLGRGDRGAFAVDPLAASLLDAFVAGAGGNVLLMTSPLSRPADLAGGVLVDPARVAARGWLEAYARTARSTGASVTYRSYDEEREPSFRDAELFVDSAHLGPQGAAALSERVAADLVVACPSSTTGG